MPPNHSLEGLILSNIFPVLSVNGNSRISQGSLEAAGKLAANAVAYRAAAEKAKKLVEYFFYYYFFILSSLVIWDKILKILY